MHRAVLHLAVSWAPDHDERTVMLMYFPRRPGNLNVTTSPAEMPPVGVPVNDPGLRVSAPPPGPAMPPTLPPLPRTQQGYGSDNTAAAMPELNPPPSYSDMSKSGCTVASHIFHHPEIPPVSCECPSSSTANQ